MFVYHIEPLCEKLGNKIYNIYVIIYIENICLPNKYICLKYTTPIEIFF